MNDEDGNFPDNGYSDYLYQQQNAWKEDILAHDCPVASFGSYQPANDVCEFECPWRTSCMKIQREAKIQASAEAWLKLFCQE